MKMEDNSRLTILSLGAGVQSTALLLASAEGILPKVDACIFSDTGWEPKGVYEHLDRLEREVAIPAGIPIYRVSAGNIRADALDPSHRSASMPLFLKNRETGKKGMARRQCTSEYKIKPIARKVRELLGAPLKDNGVAGKVPSGRWALQWIGISTDEFERAKDSMVSYTRNAFPLLDLNWNRKTCISYLESRGWGSTQKSACIGCPFHQNSEWRRLRDTDPEAWQDAVEFDKEIRKGNSLTNWRADLFLHRSCLPLDEAPIHIISKSEYKENEQTLWDEEVSFTCSPFACQGDELAPALMQMLAEDEEGDN